jgi:hypothetical protein
MLTLVMLMAAVAGVGGQEQDAAHRAYFRAVASYFHLPASEIAILGDWELPADEIPVVLFVANRAGVSPEALVALRTSGKTWAELAGRYSIGAPTLHVPLRPQASVGPLGATYERFRSTPVADWNRIDLTDRDIIMLVNLRVLAAVLDLRPGEILAQTASAPTFVQLYQQLIR